MADPLSHVQPEADVAGYLLGTLQDEEARAFADHLAGCDACRMEVDELAGIAALLDDVPDGWSLPVELEERTFAAVMASAVDLPGPTSDGPDEDSSVAPVDALAGLGTGAANVVPISAARGRPRRLLIAGVAAAVVLIAGIAAFTKLRSNPAPLATIQLISADGGRAHGDAVIVTSQTGLFIHMTVDGLPPAPTGQVYTCWLVAGNDSLAHPDRVSVGSFIVRGPTVHAAWTTAASLTRFPHMGITLEPDNGNPSHQGPKVLTGV
jgi:Anti-sigma-K factor rskA/Putative zinc-finger